MNILAGIKRYFSPEYCFVTLGETFKEIKDIISPGAKKLKLSADACCTSIRKHNGNL